MRRKARKARMFFVVVSIMAVLASIALFITLSVRSTAQQEENLTIARAQVMTNASALCQARADKTKKQLATQRSAFLEALIMYSDTWSAADLAIQRNFAEPVYVINAAASICGKASKLIHIWGTKNTESAASTDT